MVDSILPITTVLSSLNENSTGLITAQNIRNAILSTRGVYGSVLVFPLLGVPQLTTITGLTTSYAKLSTWYGTGGAAAVTTEQAGTMVVDPANGQVLPAQAGTHLVFADGMVSRQTFVGQRQVRLAINVQGSGVVAESSVNIRSTPIASEYFAWSIVAPIFVPTAGVAVDLRFRWESFAGPDDLLVGLANFGIIRIGP